MLNYLETQAQNPNNTLLFVGYQAEGTRGRKLLEGDRELKVYGKTVPFQMEVAEIEGLSAHADHDELLDWLSKVEQKPERIFIVHGEKEASEALLQGIQETYEWSCEIPELYAIEQIVN